LTRRVPADRVTGFQANEPAPHPCRLRCASQQRAISRRALERQCQGLWPRHLRRKRHNGKEQRD
jgi:hypothetical protein